MIYFAWFKDMAHHSRLVSYSILSHVHSEWVRRVRYFPESDMLMSCSNTSKESLVFRSLDDKKRKTYVFRVTKVSVFSIETIGVSENDPSWIRTHDI